MIEHAIRTFVLADPTVAGLIGPRWHPVTLPQGSAFPAVTYQRVSTSPTASHDGPCGLAELRLQVDIWGDVAGRWDTVAEVGHALRQALDGVRGAFGDIWVSRIALANEHDTFEPDVKLWRRMQDYRVYHQEATGDDTPV